MIRTRLHEAARVKTKNFRDRHLTDPCRNRNERAHERNESTEEHEWLSASREPNLGAVEVLMGEKHVLADAIDEAATTEATDRIPDRRSR